MDTEEESRSDLFLYSVQSAFVSKCRVISRRESLAKTERPGIELTAGRLQRPVMDDGSGYYDAGLISQENAS